MLFYSNVPMAEENKCPSHLHHNRLARQVNLRLTRSGPDCAWRIFYFADSIFTGMQSTATPQVPLGVSPPEDLWWKYWMSLEFPNSNKGDMHWPNTARAGLPSGANTLNPLNGFIFGRTTAENKIFGKQGPWAEGNVFEKTVESSKAVLSNKQYWESAFRQRGAMSLNNYFRPEYLMPNPPDWRKRDSFKGFWPQFSWAGSGLGVVADQRIYGSQTQLEYLPNPYDPAYLSQGLFAAGRYTEKYFKEYASQHVYMRYPPSLRSGAYWSYFEPQPAPDGVLKRKNAAKDLMHWALWVYSYYFKGSEAQRSLFCQRRPWKVRKMDYDTTAQYQGQQRPFLTERFVNGPLTVCHVGFNFYKYFTRQNVLAPALGHPYSMFGGGDYAFEDESDSVFNPDGSFSETMSKRRTNEGYRRLDGIGNPKLKQYRVSYFYEIPPATEAWENAPLYTWCYRGDNSNWSPSLNFSPKYEKSYKVWHPRSMSSGNSTGGVENYDWYKLNTRNGIYGKTIRVEKKHISDTKPYERLVMRCRYDSFENNELNSNTFTYNRVSSTEGSIPSIGGRPERPMVSVQSCLAGYYLETTPVENPNMRFKLRIWSADKIVHETIIRKKYSYAVNRNFPVKNNTNHTPRAYVFNKMFYFKEGIVDRPFLDRVDKIKFEIVPVYHDKDPPFANVTTIFGNQYKQRIGDGLISLGNPFSATKKEEFYVGSEEGKYLETPSPGALIDWEAGVELKGAQYLKHRTATREEDGGLQTGDMVRIKITFDRMRQAPSLSGDIMTNYVNNGKVLFVRREKTGLYVNGKNNELKSNADETDAGEPLGSSGGDKLYFYERRDHRSYRDTLSNVLPDGSIRMQDVQGIPVEVNVKIYEWLTRQGTEYGAHPMPKAYWNNSTNHLRLPSKTITIEKMEPPYQTFKVTLDLAILVKAKPTFQDSYALLRAATTKNIRPQYAKLLGDEKKGDMVGHHFTEANRVFNSYYKYGSAMNIYGRDRIPELYWFVNSNPVYESMRKFISSYMRFADRKVLINYTVESGKGVFYFKRYGNPASSNVTAAKKVILRNMEPPIDPCGWFETSQSQATQENDPAKWNPIKADEEYKVFCPRYFEAQTVPGHYIIYDGKKVSNGQTFKGVAGKEHIESNYGPFFNPRIHGAFKVEGIVKEISANKTDKYQAGDNLIWSDDDEYAVSDTPYAPAYLAMKEFTTEKTGTFRIRWSGKISSGVHEGTGKEHNWGWRIMNYTSGQPLATGSWVDGLDTGQIPNAHAYRRFKVDVSVLDFEESDIGLEMVSTNGIEQAPVDGDNQTLYAKNFRIYTASGSVTSETNEWIMFMTSSHYHWSNTNPYKPDVYNDIMCFLNNRCHHRSFEYERQLGNKYDMIRTELCRVMPGPRTTPGPRLLIFLSKSSNNLTYVYNTNDPYTGNLLNYAEIPTAPYGYYKSCPLMTPSPYKVESVTIVDAAGMPPHFQGDPQLHPQKWTTVRVELNRPLRNTGKLNVGASGWRGVNPDKFVKEPYRTDENAIMEYLHHQAGGYSCKRNMIGDYGANTGIHDIGGAVGGRPFGACYPRFYFLKLIPEVAKGSILSTEPYAQMDFYFRGMSSAFINPYSTPAVWPGPAGANFGRPFQTGVLNWEFATLASRSSEEDPTLYEYIDPRNIQS